MSFLKTDSRKKERKNNVPRHVAIIMDGNGRWAKQNGLSRIEGHKQGALQVREIFKCAAQEGIEFLTLYAFSSENWQRPKMEIKALMNLLLTSLKKYEREFLENEIRFKTIGNILALPKNCQKAINSLVEKTSSFTKCTLILALNYGSRDELVRAANRLKSKKGDIVWDDIANALDTSEFPDPDLLIRTSGEMRLSNFLLLQVAYAEFYFTNVYWPDFDANELKKALAEYAKRERRYGLTTEQLEKEK